MGFIFPYQNILLCYCFRKPNTFSEKDGSSLNE